jgi:subtilase family serine protease
MVPAFLVCAFSVSAQQFVAPRITRPVNDSELVTLPQRTHPLARPEFDRGPAPPNLPMTRMMLIVKRSPDQAAQLRTLLDSQLRASSPQYHQWLTPEQFGARFGAADQDLNTVAVWLQSHGFVVHGTAKGKGTIEFSGNAGQVSEAFHTAIHRFVVNGEEHWANTASPSIPAALAPLVGGISTLNNFRLQTRATDRKGKSYPLYTASDGNHALVPADYATIYNINPLYRATPAIDGTGTTIAVVGATYIDPQDITDFRKEFGIKAYTPQILYPYGQPIDGDASEGTLDVSWSGATAPGAAINFVAIPDTFADSGLLLAENYIVDNNLGDIITESFGVCEGYSYPGLNTFIESTREQAAAQGMTYIVSAGDDGPYGCDDFDIELTVADPTLLSVNVLASSPYVTAVGGTSFNAGASPSQFWGPVTRLPFGTAKSYIPEDTWEDSCDSTFCFMNILAGSGGQSSVYPKPSWQSGVTGIQQDGTRDLPDVSLAAGSVVPYLFCLTGSCEEGEFYAASGTSAAAPSFAGNRGPRSPESGYPAGSHQPATLRAGRR